VSVTVRDIRAYKERGERFPMLTCYDALSARLLEEAGIPVLLVGDTLGMVTGTVES
jgi:3-methyl-2-oxobutanoate hydroxymethyltransferase